MMKNKKGLVLTEVLLAVSMLMIAVMVLGTIIDSVVKMTALSKNHLIAENLATEAIEGVKNLRDTNWLQEPDDESCWRRKDPLLSCTGNDLIQPGGSYIVRQNAEDHWSVEEMPGELELEDGVDNSYLLYIENIGGVFDGYIHNGTAGSESMFYRSAYFEEANDQILKFMVKVQWLEGTKVRGLERQVLLMNY